jgi:hypothetical protein
MESGQDVALPVRASAPLAETTVGGFARRGKCPALVAIKTRIKLPPQFQLVRECKRANSIGLVPLPQHDERAEFLDGALAVPGSEANAFRLATSSWRQTKNIVFLPGHPPMARAFDRNRENHGTLN